MKLDVFKNNIFIGTLSKKENALIFNSIKDDKNIPFKNGQDVSSWFKNILPETGRKRTFEILVKASLGDLTEYLSQFGEDLPGDISVGQGNENTDAIDGIIEQVIGDNENIDYLNYKTSLPGAEPKASLVVKIINGKRHFYHPSKKVPSTHIIKSSKYLTVVEALSMEFAKNCDFFPVAKQELLAIAGNPALLIERYDRKNGERLFQEDFCQILERDPEDKYKVTNAEIASILMDRLDEENRILFLRMQIFNMLVGNSDDHAKNFSLLSDDGWKLAPAYDIISAATMKAIARERPRFPTFLKNLDLGQARPFGKTHDPQQIRGDDIISMAEIFSFPLTTMIENMREITQKTKEQINAFSFGIPMELAPNHKIYAEQAFAKFKRVITKRSTSLTDVFERAFSETKNPSVKKDKKHGPKP